MARDILAIPISTVASEAAFSTGERILDQFRSSLTPIMVQALICTQDWIHRSNDPMDIEEKFEMLEEFKNENGITPPNEVDPLLPALPATSTNSTSCSSYQQYLSPNPVL